MEYVTADRINHRERVEQTRVSSQSEDTSPIVYGEGRRRSPGVYDTETVPDSSLLISSRDLTGFNLYTY
jgi:myo-inositol-hexaphosphate 3-phosphohydrolase